MFRGDITHSGIYKGQGPKSFEKVKWVFKTDGWVISSPTLTDGVLYVGSDDGKLYAIDADKGQEKWHFATTGGFAGGPIRSTAAIVNGTVYFSSYDGFFYALEAATGKLKWKFEHGERQLKPNTCTTGPRLTKPAPIFGTSSSPQPQLTRVWFTSVAVTATCTHWTPGPDS